MQYKYKQFVPKCKIAYSRNNTYLYAVILEL